MYIPGINCDKCFGNKKIMGAGMLYDNCHVCSGTGLLVTVPVPDLEKIPKKSRKVSTEEITKSLFE